MTMKVFRLMVAALLLSGIMYILTEYSNSGSHERKEWEFSPAQMRLNFEPIRTPEQDKRLLQEALDRELAKAGLPVVPGRPSAVLPPAGNDGAAPPPANGGKSDTPDSPTAVDQRELWAERDTRDLKMARDQLQKPRVFEPARESEFIPDFTDFQDADRAQCMGEFEANRGLQAPTHERMALEVLHKLPGITDFAARIHPDGYFFAPGRAAIEFYRGRGFAVEGRLFDLREIKADPPHVLNNGAKINSYYEGIIALVGKGQTAEEQPVEHRVVLFQSLALPTDLLPYVNTTGAISQADKLATENVSVKLTGAFLRRWIYSREVTPFSTPGKRVYSQAHAPLLMTADVRKAEIAPVTPTDPMLQQITDDQRQDPSFVATEAGYYALLNQVNNPDDAPPAVENIGYFDLVGSGETGPRYRGQGVHVNGMIGDDYAPVILPPNVSGARRVFRAYLLGETINIYTPKRYLIDMIEPPKGLEPRALVSVTARYYRNVFEAEDKESIIRPLLVIRKIDPRTPPDEGTDWVAVCIAIGGFFVVIALAGWFLFGDRRERRNFEATSMEAARRRLEKRGGLKLKPLPGHDNARDPGGQPPPAPPKT